MNCKPKSDRSDARLTVVCGEELRAAVVQYQKQIEAKTRIRTSLSAAAESLLRQGLRQTAA